MNGMVISTAATIPQIAQRTRVLLNLRKLIFVQHKSPNCLNNQKKEKGSICICMFYVLSYWRRVFTFHCLFWCLSPLQKVEPYSHFYGEVCSRNFIRATQSEVVDAAIKWSSFADCAREILNPHKIKHFLGNQSNEAFVHFWEKVSQYNSHKTRHPASRKINRFPLK